MRSVEELIRLSRTYGRDDKYGSGDIINELADALAALRSENSEIRSALAKIEHHVNENTVENEVYESVVAELEKLRGVAEDVRAYLETAKNWPVGLGIASQYTERFERSIADLDAGKGER